MNEYKYAGSEEYPEGHPLRGVMEKQWFRRELGPISYRDRLVKAQHEFISATEDLSLAEKRYDEAKQALRDAIDDK